jgi:hydrogenase maturation protease
VRWMVIGYGSDLRGDDAVGRLAAAAVTEWRMPDVQVLSVHQLTPELAAPLAEADRALFLDAHPAGSNPAVAVRRLAPATRLAELGHSGDPGRVLAWTARLFGRTPRAWWITLPAADFAFGAPLSPTAARGLAEGLATIRSLLTTDASEMPKSGWQAR